MRAWCRVEKIITRKKKIPRLNWKSVCIGARWVQPDRSRLGNSKKLAWILLNFFASLWCFFIYWSLLLFEQWTHFSLFFFHSFLVDIERPTIRRIRSRFAFFLAYSISSDDENPDTKMWGDKLKKLFHNCRRWWSVPRTNSFQRKKNTDKRVMMNFVLTFLFSSSSRSNEDDDATACEWER